MRKLGINGPLSSDIGLGCMGMSDLYGPSDESAGIATIHKALDSGINLLDTGDFYGMGHNEMLIAKALQDRNRSDVIISVKFGALRDPKGNWIGFDGRPEAVKNALAYSLKRLNTDYIDIYRMGRIDPNVPVEDTIGAIADMVKEGYVRHIGLSEVGANTLKRANSVHQISDLQIEYAIISRGIEHEILPQCRELGIGITAYGVLARGLLSGHWTSERSIPMNDFRHWVPRFSGENLEKNLELVRKLSVVATERGMTMTQLAIAWVKSRGVDIVPLVGARKPEQLDEALGAMNAVLSIEDMTIIEEIVPAGFAAGDRYPTPMMAVLDSEK